MRRHPALFTVTNFLSLSCHKFRERYPLLYEPDRDRDTRAAEETRYSGDGTQATGREGLEGASCVGSCPSPPPPSLLFKITFPLGTIPQR